MFDIVKYCSDNNAKVEYTKVKTATNDPSSTRASRYAAYARGTMQRRAYQKIYSSTADAQLAARGIIGSSIAPLPYFLSPHWNLYPAIGDPVYRDANGQFVRDSQGYLLDANGQRYGLQPGQFGTPDTSSVIIRGPYIL
jgi:hypothetical protein